MQRVALHLLITALWFTASALNCCSQTSANTATAGGDVTRAVAEAQKAVQSNPEDGNSWEKLGLANLQAGNYHEAITALRTAVAKGYPAQTGNYNLACAYARAGESGKALDLLQALIAAGYPAPIASDPDLASLSGEPRFKEMAAAVQRVREPCKDSQAIPNTANWISG
jgi:Flp pilus assembly protein TadD